MKASWSLACIATIQLFALAATAGEAVATVPAPASGAPDDVLARYTFSWPVGPGAPAPRGGTTRGVPVERDRAASPAWKGLQQQGLSALERDRRAILAMAGEYRVNFDFLEVAAFTGSGDRPRPYQSWGTEKVYVDRDEPGRISLVHILEMRVLGADGRASEPMVTKHWRQEWVYEPGSVIEFQGGNRWAKRTLSPAERSGRWAQFVYQVDEAPRYGSVGRWEHNASFSSWLSSDTARPLPRREWSVRKDYDHLFGTNRHTIVPTGWIQEENNLKRTAGDAAQPFVGREYGVARYERLKGADFAAADRYHAQTREFWNAVVEDWDHWWKSNDSVVLTEHSDQSGAFAGLFRLAEDFAAGRLRGGEMSEKIRAAHARLGAN
jgi:hypothetical protein